MNPSLALALAKQARHRAHLAGAEAADLERRADALAPGPLPPTIDDCSEDQLRAVYLAMDAHDTRRRYWRELASCHRLIGMPMPALEALG